ncbi:cell division protein FtsW, lipid II flippase [Clostridium amylolyticum]|uniref:Cell division protein FtsW, lipid II flippase n=1 Tax=Clostridium amylolyticum TaxID=1121298 RepID=A0A1M6H181_9CLOT|nr:FtsW/RodA/SpoVE family cell cycle protein [Clostridium amylolyticum]SHJ15970.1 cell division protein FtsW, lipid II flippase [Clostridium amylolyticum]
MYSFRDEKRMLFLTYLLCIALFVNLALLKQPMDKGALIMGGVMCVLIGYAHFIIRKFYPDGDKYILIFASILSVIGAAMLYRIDMTVAIKQVVWFVLGMAGYILIVVLLPDLKSFSKYKYIYMAGTLIFMGMATFIGRTLYGAKNWVYIGSFGFQPSELGKVFLILYLAAALRGYESFKQLIEPAIIVMISLGFMVLQRDLGSALIIFGISITILYIATSKLKYIIACLGLFSVGSVASYKLFDHIRIRVMIWKEPWKYSNDESYQIVQGLIAISSGGLFGSGLGQGFPKWVPVKTSDYIFAIICEELGIIIAVGIIIIYFLLCYRSMRAALKADDGFSQLAAVGFSAMIASQVLVIIGGVFNIIPLTGITLPLISYGGSSMLTMFFSLGILQKISEEG